MKVDVVILAAGQGTRMKSKLPKVLHPVAGRPLVQHVIDTAREIEDAKISVVIGHGAEHVQSRFAQLDVHWVVQEQQLGTGHAVQQALDHFRPDTAVLILYGDVPLIKKQTLVDLVSQVDESRMALLTATFDDPTGYGRIIRDQGKVTAIVEQKDASEEQLQVREINTGILAVQSNLLMKWLPQLSNENAQGEFYLTDIIAMAAAEGVQICTAQPTALHEIQGVNNRLQLAELERAFQNELAERLLLQGVSLADPARIDVRGELIIGQDCSIDINCVFEGKVEIGDNVRIGPNCVIKASTIADNVEIKEFSSIDDSHIEQDCVIGPYARLRPQTYLAAKAKIGNFVETKKSTIGKGSKVNHLTYIGDATIGEDVNVGAGTITCNYDGVNKFKTELADGVFVGSNTSLVAPVKVGKNATIGAGSTITQDVPDEQLAVARGKQRNINGWKRPTKK